VGVQTASSAATLRRNDRYENDAKQTNGGIFLDAVEVTFLTV